MSAPLSFVRLTMVGVLLCTVLVAQRGEGHAQESRTFQPSQAQLGTATVVSIAISADAELADIRGHVGHDGHDGHDGEMPKRNDDSESPSDRDADSAGLEAGDDDFDDFEDIAFHPRPTLAAQVAPEPMRHGAWSHARAYVRVEDCRCDKPPRV